MRKAVINSLIAALAFSAVCTSCNRDDGVDDPPVEKVKLMASITRNNGSSEKYEYDDQNRLIKHLSSANEATVNPYQTDEFTYSAGGDLLRFERKNVANPSNSVIEEFVKNGNQITITVKRSGQQDAIITLDLNSDGFPARYENTVGEITFIRTYYYQGGNLVKYSDTRSNGTVTVPAYDYEYEHDSMKNPRMNIKCPKWYMIWYFGSNGGKNNTSSLSSYSYNAFYDFNYTGERTRSRLRDKTYYIYDYDSDGFPVKVTAGESRDTEVENVIGYIEK